MSDDIKITTVTVPMLDTGIGREAGFKNDAELIAAANAERAALTPAERELANRIDEKLDDMFVNGVGGNPK